MPQTNLQASAGLTSLSEHASKEFLRRWGIPVTREALAHTPAEAAAAARQIGFPVAVKASGAAFAHKTELGLVELDLRDEGEVEAACARLASRAEGLAEFLVQEMVQGRRELIAGLIRDPQYGPAVMLGLGGVLAEALGDAVFRVVPLSVDDAMEMMDDLRGRRLLGEFRGEPAVDRQALAGLLVALGEIGLAEPGVAEIDLNPVKLAQGRPVAVDALVVRVA
jgi:acetyl-CoA synthetase (ADP-forming)